MGRANRGIDWLANLTLNIRKGKQYIKGGTPSMITDRSPQTKKVCLLLLLGGPTSAL
jgi:hypothetical protein